MNIKVSFIETNDIHYIIEMEKDFYPVEGIIAEEDFKKRFNKNKYQTLVAKDDNGNVLGALNIMPLTEATFNKLLNGTFDEHEDLESESILSLEDGMTADFYSASFITNNDVEVAARLMYGLIMYARLLRKKNIKINRIGSIAATKDGERLCQKLGFDMILELDSYICGFIPKIYILDMKKESKSFLVNKIRRIIYK